MRNRLTHEHYDIDVEVLWDTLTADIAELEQTLSAVAERSQAPSAREPSTEQHSPCVEPDTLDL